MYLNSLFGDDDFFRQNAFFSSDDDVVNTVSDSFHRVWVSAGAAAIVGLEMVNQGPSHVVHFDVGVAFKMLEDEVHLAVVGVGNHFDLALGVVFTYAVIRAKEPIAAFNALGVALVVGCGMHPNRIGKGVADD